MEKVELTQRIVDRLQIKAEKRKAQRTKGVKYFIQIVKDTYNRHYGVDEAGTHWRLDKLASKGVTYQMV